MPQPTHALLANSVASVAGSSVVPFPTSLAMATRLRIREVAVDDAPFWHDLRAGYAVATTTGCPAADSLWVRDNTAWVHAFTRWHTLPIRIVGELFVVPGG